jgi:hypothetical protein
MIAAVIITGLVVVGVILARWYFDYKVMTKVRAEVTEKERQFEGALDVSFKNVETSVVEISKKIQDVIKLGTEKIAEFQELLVTNEEVQSVLDEFHNFSELLNNFGVYMDAFSSNEMYQGDDLLDEMMEVVNEFTDSVEKLATIFKESLEKLEYEEE